MIVLALAACVRGPASIAPVGLMPGERAVVDRWLTSYRPAQARLYTIRPWRYRNERGAAAGRAAVRVAPPDSLRFDYQGPLRKSGRAAVVGDSALWVIPEDDFGWLVAFSPLFWAAIGVPQPPPAGTPVLTLTREGVRAWSYTIDGDTLSFVLRGQPATRLLGEIRRAGRTIGLADVTLDPVRNLPIRARIDLPIEPSRLEFTIEHVDTAATLEPSIWHQNP